MRKALLLFCFSIPLYLCAFSQFDTYCDKQAPKISFSGKAPWKIDGKMDDWQTIIGPYTGVHDPFNPEIIYPFTPPQTSAFNWVLDVNYNNDDPSFGISNSPAPQSDLFFLAFTHDDYNVYFYFRRRTVDNSLNSFYYFLDLNSDALMNEGEPVIHGSFNKNTASALTLSRYVVNKNVNYDTQLKGDTMASYDGGISSLIDFAPMSGSLVDVLTSTSLTGNEKLKKNEVFAAAVTEEGYGVELSIPVRFLRNWIVEKQKTNTDHNGKGHARGRHKAKYAKTDPINIRTDIFFYKVSMQNSAGPYNPAQVVDNAGSCGGGVGVSGSPNVSKSIKTTILEPGQSYQFGLTYTNLVNKEIVVGIEDIPLYHRPSFTFPINNGDYTMVVYPDPNCNGKVDLNEDTVVYWAGGCEVGNRTHRYSAISYGPELGSDSDLINLGPYYDFDAGICNIPAEISLPPLGKGCFNAFLTIKPEKAITTFDIAFETSLFFLNGYEFCEPSCGGKPINPIGFVKTSVGTLTISKALKFDIIIPKSDSANNVYIYPNPSNGAVKVILPQQEGAAVVSLQDYIGRTVQIWKDVRSNSLQLSQLNPGIYILKVQFIKSGRIETHKIVVQ